MPLYCCDAWLAVGVESSVMHATINDEGEHGHNAAGETNGSGCREETREKSSKAAAERIEKRDSPMNEKQAKPGETRKRKNTPRESEPLERQEDIAAGKPSHGPTRKRLGTREEGHNGTPNEDGIVRDNQQMRGRERQVHSREGSKPNQQRDKAVLKLRSAEKQRELSWDASPRIDKKKAKPVQTSNVTGAPAQAIDTLQALQFGNNTDMQEGPERLVPATGAAVAAAVPTTARHDSKDGVGRGEQAPDPFELIGIECRVLRESAGWPKRSKPC